MKHFHFDSSLPIILGLLIVLFTVTEKQLIVFTKQPIISPSNSIALNWILFSMHCLCCRFFLQAVTIQIAFIMGLISLWKEEQVTRTACKGYVEWILLTRVFLGGCCQHCLLRYEQGSHKAYLKKDSIWVIQWQETKYWSSKGIRMQMLCLE